MSKVIAKMELLKPTIQEYQESVKHNVIVKCRRANLPVEEANKILMKEVKKVTRELLSSEGCNPYKVAILPWVQIPLWIVISFAIRNMSGVYPGMTPLYPDSTASLATEGTLWFKDLTLIDPYYILPCLLVITNFLNIELHSLRRQAPTRLQRVMTNTFRVLTFGMGYVSAQMPTAMVLYWSLSSTYGLSQNLLFKYPQVRRVLRIPKTPSESRTPYRDLLVILRDKARKFILLQHSKKQ
ncbi:cytochrome c oxidase assembly protein COX18, mitochondrial-like isoform X2 [Halichondria panicea]|uniref:cytochrome c oxidase assembly protein COX18, mitochondrial-like isoform X2 n=1 Tax=Halichondria panicea TaxID=6063 RepID=UPI00312B7CD4